MLTVGLHTPENNKTVDIECEQASWNLSSFFASYSMMLSVDKIL
jgi:hypothetical protein